MEIKNEDEYARASERADQLHDSKIEAERQELAELLQAMKVYEYDFVKMLRDYL